MSILRVTQHFLRLYLYAAGQSEIPIDFHRWSCLSLIAACVADRVYLNWLREDPLLPNLYTFLISPSGIGKDLAIKVALRLGTNEEWVEQKINAYQGKLTAPYLIDLLGKPAYNEETNQMEIPNPKIWFITPELRQSVGKGEHAESLIDHMTGLYGGNMTIKEGTRTRGGVKIRDACINWLAGTTPSWLIKAVGIDAILGGFFARVLPVYLDYGDLPERQWTPTYPSDYDEIMDYLAKRVQALCFAEGAFEITPKADAAGKRWYYNRPDCSDDLRRPAFQREREMVLKIAMLLALADGGRLLIDEMHIQTGIALLKSLTRRIPKLLEITAGTPATEAVRRVMDCIQRTGEISRTDLGQRMRYYGIDRKMLKDSIDTLMEWKLIKAVPCGKGGTAYRWTG